MTKQIGTTQLIDTWASDGPVIEPTLQKKEQGWQEGERPPNEFMNWLQNTFGQKINRMLRDGVSAWAPDTEYEGGNAVSHAGFVWMATTGNTNSAPSASNTNWSRVLIRTDFATQAQAQAGSATTLVMTPLRATQHFNARTSAFGRELVQASDASAVRTALSVLPAGTGASQIRNNSQLDSRYVQQSNYNGLWDTRYNSVTTSFGRDWAQLASAAAGRSTLGVLGAGTGASQIRTNSQLDSRYVQQSNYNGLWTSRLNAADLDSRYVQQSNYNSLWTARFENVTSSTGRNLINIGFVSDMRDFLNVHGAGTGASQVRNNSQLDSRYVQSILPSGALDIGAVLMAANLTGSNFQPGGTISGSNLRIANADGTQGPIITIPGTWRCQGFAEGGGTAARRVTIWQRIS